MSDETANGLRTAPRLPWRDLYDALAAELLRYLWRLTGDRGFGPESARTAYPIGRKPGVDRMNDRALLHELLDMARDGGYLLHDIWGALRGRYAVPDERAMRKLVRDAVAQLIDAGYVSVSYGYYDWHNAMTYADTWALGFNTASYRTQTGDDCTNFVSQALKAGTWQDAGGWYTDDHAWWYNSLTQTYTWVGVLHLLNFMSYSGRAQFMPYLTDMLIGDVIQVNGQIQHSMIVDDRWGGTLDQIFIDYHSNPNKHRPLVDFLGDVPISQNSYYAEHILGTY